MARLQISPNRALTPNNYSSSMSKIYKVTTEIYAALPNVWEALTSQKGLAKWFSESTALEPHVGGSFKFKGNFVYGWREGRDFRTKVTAYQHEQEFGFEFPLHHVGGGVTNCVARFELSASGKSTQVSLTCTFDGFADLNQYAFNDIWAYYLNALTNVCEHDFHEPALLFDFTRAWKGNIKHVIYITSTPDIVFDYLYKPELVAKYFTDVKVFEPREEGRIDFGWGQGEGPSRVLLFDPPYELAYDWPVPQDGQIHLGRVKWTIEPEGRQVRLEMKQSGFGDDVDHYQSGEALGWANIMLELKRVIESGRPALNRAGKTVDA